MAFTSADKISIAKIINWALGDLDVHLLTYAPTISSDMEAAVLVLISEFDALPADDGVEVFPNEKNFGARVQNARSIAEARIIKGIHVLLNIPRQSASMSLMERG